MVSVQAAIDRVRSPDCPAEELLATLRTGAPIVVANVLDQMGNTNVVPRAAAIEALEAAARDPRFAFRLMGTITLAHLAVKALMQLGGEARDRAQALMHTWPEPDRSDLLWFLRSEGIEL